MLSSFVVFLVLVASLAVGSEKESMYLEVRKQMYAFADMKNAIKLLLVTLIYTDPLEEMYNTTVVSLDFADRLMALKNGMNKDMIREATKERAILHPKKYLELVEATRLVVAEVDVFLERKSELVDTRKRKK